MDFGEIALHWIHFKGKKNVSPIVVAVKCLSHLSFFFSIKVPSDSRCVVTSWQPWKELAKDDDDDGDADNAKWAVRNAKYRNLSPNYSKCRHKCPNVLYVYGGAFGFIYLRHSFEFLSVCALNWTEFIGSSVSLSLLFFLSRNPSTRCCCCCSSSPSFNFNIRALNRVCRHFVWRQHANEKTAIHL